MAEQDHKIVTITSTDIDKVIVNQSASTSNNLLVDYYEPQNIDLLSKINDLETRLKALEEAYMELILLGKSE